MTRVNASGKQNTKDLYHVKRDRTTWQHMGDFLLDHSANRVSELHQQRKIDDRLLIDSVHVTLSNLAEELICFSGLGTFPSFTC